MIEEIHGGLVDTVAAYTHAGTAHPRAARPAVEEFGTVDEIAPGCQREPTVARARHTARAVALAAPFLVAWYLARTTGQDQPSALPRVAQLLAVHLAGVAGAAALLAAAALAVTGTLARRAARAAPAAPRGRLDRYHRQRRHGGRHARAHDRMRPGHELAPARPGRRPRSPVARRGGGLGPRVPPMRTPADRVNPRPPGMGPA
ncbi:hypothetical protein [Actinacidiphila glaucinigra]|uniref:hypothetical protein n=1 Tax=Actinacidiphila glaucinigra TaxID=235986 RepID=UPI00386EF8A8